MLECFTSIDRPRTTETGKKLVEEEDGVVDLSCSTKVFEAFLMEFVVLGIVETDS
jgi:hypothetical protein